MQPRQPPGLVFFDSRDGVPVLAAYREAVPGKDTDALHVWCAHCDKLHTHGGEGKTPIPHYNHRAAHCGSEHSPYALSGYYLREVGDFPKAWRKFIRRRQTRAH